MIKARESNAGATRTGRTNSTPAGGVASRAGSVAGAWSRKVRCGSDARWSPQPAPAIAAATAANTLRRDQDRDGRRRTAGMSGDWIGAIIAWAEPPGVEPPTTGRRVAPSALH